MKKRWSLAVFILFFPFAAASQQIPDDAYAALQWRFVGPQRAGWATVAEGIPDEPNTFYFGAVGGGVWKTTDAGWTWTGLMQHEKSSSVGALAISPSDPKTIYVGTGQVAYRYDILPGDGVYRSDDGGNSWKHIGLSESRQIGRILVDPENAQRVLVAAMGHIFGSNPERGVFLSTDGGESWRNVLFVDEKTGAVDLAFDPTYPSTVYAATWQVRMHPWLDYFEDQFLPGSGMYRSTDSGEHWTRLTGGGLPTDNIGRIGLAVARGSSGEMVYAAVEGPAQYAGIYRSSDAGRNWLHVCSDASLGSSYFGRVTVDPTNADVVYVMGRSISRSTDGGEHFTLIKGAPGGDDYHFLWINPKQPRYMITASDQGAVVTVNGGSSWSNWYNQPTGQFYHVAADDRFPYRIYGSQQDNGTVQILSRGPYGVIDERDWHPVGADERDYVIPKPGNPDMVFGSGLGGALGRFDEATRQSAQVSPWPVSSYGARPTSVKYRYTWITPIAISPIKPYPLYFGAQVLFRSTSDGDDWDIVSPDLTGKKDDAVNCESPNPEEAIACGYGVIYEIEPSPLETGMIWVGTDNGLIHVTTDSGAEWKNVTPREVPHWARIDAIVASRFSVQKAYVGVNLRRLDRPVPLILKTTDLGGSWVAITNGLPDDEYVNVVVEDPVRPGLLFAGTSRGVYVSFNEGAFWQSLSLQLPTASVRDLLVHEGDLIAATQGRGIWVLDNVAPLRELNPGVVQEPEHLFQPAPAWRLRGNENRDTPWPPSTPLAQNPPAGAIVDYWLRKDAEGPVTLTVIDPQGKIVRRFSSEDQPEQPAADRYFEEGWLGPDSRPGSGTGMHRFVWDLRYSRPAAIEYSYSIAAVWKEGTPMNPRGPLVLPGEYSVVLMANGREQERKLTVRMDPRVNVDAKALRDQLEFARTIESSLENGTMVYGTIDRILKEKRAALTPGVMGSLSALADGSGTGLKSVCSDLAELHTAAISADGRPTEGQRAAFAYYEEQLAALLSRWKKIQAGLSDQNE